MIQTTLFSIILITAMTFLQMNHPLAMGLMLMVQTLLTCLITGNIAKTFWFSYILFLVFLGGMLVLFVYVTSLASNEMFSLSSKLTVLIALMLIVFMLTTMIMDKSLLSSFLQNNEMNTIVNKITYMKENSLDLMKLYNYPNNLITILLINYLLISLVAIVKITNVFHGPLRPMMHN